MVCSGIDFEGTTYEITFASDTTAKKLRVLSQDFESVPAGKVSFVTNPPKKIEDATFSFVGPSGTRGKNDEIRTYRIRFNWPGAPGVLGVQLEGTLSEEGVIYMDYVEPVVTAIDYKALFRNDYKGHQWYGDMINCAGQDIAIFVDFENDGKKAREALEGKLTSTADRPRPGLYGLGETCYSQGDPVNVLRICSLCFVRDNLFITAADAGVTATSPAVKKRFVEVVYALDEAIRDENPAVKILRMPMTLTRIR